MSINSGEKMWHAVRSNLRLSWKLNLLAALPVALVTTLLSAATITTGLRPSAHLTLGLLHFVLAYALLGFLWMPLTWFRKYLLQPWPALILAIGLSLPLTVALCLIFPYHLIIGFVIVAFDRWLVEIAVVAFHLLCAFIFIWSLGNLWLLPAWFRRSWPSSSQQRAGANREKSEEKGILAEAPFRPRLLLGAISFLIGLYFVLLFEWWMANLKLTAVRDEAVHHRAFSEKIITLARLDSTNFLSLPKFFQPYQTILPPVQLRKPEKHPFLFRHRIVRLEGKQSLSLRTRMEFPVPLLATAGTPIATAQEAPPDSVAEALPVQVLAWIGSILPVISVTFSGIFLFFLGGIVPLRLMSFVLPSVWHRAAVYQERLRATPTYTGQFYLAILAHNPLFSIASLLVWIFLIAMPLLVVIGGKPALLITMVGTDQILFAFTLLAAWVSPVVYAGVYVDRTFGAYFNTKLSNLILGMRGHVVVLGFGDLGQRVVNRELMKLDRRVNEQSKRGRFTLGRKQQLNPGDPEASRRPQQVWHEKVVSPDLNIEEICTHFVIVDRNSDNFLFAATNDFLGTYGVVGALEKFQRQGEQPQLAHRQRLLVPIVQGDATEPFTLSRVNLERASFLISMVSQEERIRDIFSRAVEAGLRAIICVSRSDQIMNLTHQACRHPITLVYPKQNSGLALGQRLLAAMLKVLPSLPPGQTAPRIMVVGLNKSNHFMLETLWHNWPGAEVEPKARLFTDMLRFVITGEESIYTVPRPEYGASYFTRWWHSSYITGFRHYQPASNERPLYFPIPTCVMRADEAGVLERCLDEFRPNIVVINDDSSDRSRMLLLRAINSLERLKYEKPNFLLPLMLMSMPRVDETEQKDIGDAFRLYESLTRLYQDHCGPGHPRHAYFRQQMPSRLIGDSVHDGLADTEEIIAGIRDNWEQAGETASGGQSAAWAPGESWGEAFELNTCLPNTAGTLARLTARLAGLEFGKPTATELEKLFSTALHKGDRAPATLLRPSFQYLRHLKLGVPGHGFCLSGYADLQEETSAEVAREDYGELDAIAGRVYAKDDRDYLDAKRADPTSEDFPVPRLLTLAVGRLRQPLDTQTFVEVMMGTQGEQATSRAFCPGMTICPIASYQHYIVATNSKEIHAWQQHKENRRLRAAPNYRCAKIAVTEKAPNQFPRYARIFCCCHAKRNDPGLIAVVLNLLNFQRFAKLYRRAAREQNLGKDWIVNIEYFKNVSCQNPLFALNRLFGARRYTKDLLRENNWTMDQYEERLRTILPISLVQIMPVGGPEETRRWFDYALALYHYLWQIAPRRFCFQWWDQSEQRQLKRRLALDRDEYPIVIQINNRQHRRRQLLRQQGRCEFCEVEDPEMELGCAQQRPWMEEE